MIRLSSALYIGRFQPFHNGHYKVVKQLLEKHEKLILVIGSSESPISEKNPFSAAERAMMVRRSVEEEDLARITIVPVPDINDHSRWVGHVRSLIPDFDAVYSNNSLVTRLFKEQGVEVIPIGFIDRGKNEGKNIRRLMCAKNPEWEMHVPPGVAQYIRSIDGINRIAGLCGK